MTTSITDEGLDVNTLAQVEEELQALFLQAFPPQGDEFLDLTPDSVLGREVTVFAEQYVAFQNLTLQLAELLDWDQAQGVWIDFHLALQSTQRKPATSSTIAAQVQGLPDTPIGDKLCRFLPNDSLWRTPVDLVIGPTGITDTTLTATVGGPTNAVESGTTSWVIVDVVNDASGRWDTVESTAQANLGTEQESDVAARLRLDRSAAGLGVCTKPGIVKALLERPGMAFADIDNNRGLTPNSSGVPGKSIEAVLETNDVQDAANTILATYSGTAGTFGNTSVLATVDVTLVDGTVVPVSENVRLTIVQNIAVIARYTVSFGNAAEVPESAEDDIIAAAANYINTAGRDVDVIPGASASAAEVALPAASEPTVVGEVALKGGVLAGATIPITSREKAAINPQPQAAIVSGTNTEPFNFNVTWTLVLSINGATPLTITFAVTDFDVVSAARALEVSTVIAGQASDLAAGVDEGVVEMATLTTGSGATIEILATSSAALLTELGLVVGTTTGNDGDIEVVFV